MIEGVDGDYAVVLIGEEAGGVIRIGDGRAREDSFAGIARKDGDGLIDPGVEVFAGSVAPVDVSSDRVEWIVWNISVSKNVSGKKIWLHW